MSRLFRCFADCRESGRKALITFMTAGDPNPDATVPLMRALVRAGVDALELGVPFSDPMADGPVIQAADERALAAGMNLRKVLEMVREFRKDDNRTPVVLMGYLNPIEAMGYVRFAEEAAEAGVDGLITVDLPPEEGDDLLPELRARNIDPVFLLAPTTRPERMRVICAGASGFLYYVSLKGVTGAATLDVDAVAAKLREIREFTDLPVGVGFGIRDAASAARVARVADAVVVGSALVTRVAEHRDDLDALLASASALISDMRQAMDRGESAR